jgi:hypothetical protein
MSIEYVDSDQMARLWKISKGNHHSFPYIKLKKPIWDVRVQDIEDFNNNDFLIEALKEFCKQKTLSKKQVISLSDWTMEKLGGLEGFDDGLIGLKELIKRFPKDKKQSDAFLYELSGLIMQNAGDTNQDLYVTLLVGKIKNGKGKKKIVCDVPLFFDLSDWNQYQCRVASPDMERFVTGYLLQKEKKLQSKRTQHKLHTGPYPDPTLPVIGKIYLFSMNKNALCHERYRRIGSSIFSDKILADVGSVKSIHGAVKWCTDERQKGKTWQKVPSYKLTTVNGKKVRVSDLAIAYLEEKPQAEIELANTFASFDASEEEIGEAVYEKKTMAVCDALKGEAGLTKNSRMNVLIIAKVDKGRAQVVMNISYSIENLIKSVEQWQIASKNRPYFSVLLPGKKGEKAVIAEPSCPSPKDVMLCFQNQWIRNGLDKRNVPGVHLRHVYDLFLGEGRIAREMARMFLQLALQRLGPLLLGIAGADHTGDIKEYSFEARKTVLVGTSILAIILFKIGIKKEGYMKNVAFNIGRLLAFADGLHAQYCKLQMKKEELPPQLMGNAVMRAALDNPTQALSLLAQRIAPYYAWATKVQGKDYALTKWFLGEMGRVSSALEETELPTTTDDAMKAQILLGYLARSKSEE